MLVALHCRAARVSKAMYREHPQRKNVVWKIHFVPPDRFNKRKPLSTVGTYFFS